MNKTRRKALADLAMEIDAIRPAIEELQCEEQDFLDNMPEAMQEGEKGQAVQAAVDALEAAVCSLDDAVRGLGEAAA